MSKWIFDVSGREIINLNNVKRIYIYESDGFTHPYQIRVSFDGGFAILFFCNNLEEASICLENLYERINN